MLNTRKYAFMLCGERKLLVYEQNHMQSCKVRLNGLRQLFTDGYAREGMIDKEIAKKLGIGMTAFYRYFEKYREFRESLKRRKKYPDFSDSIKRDPVNNRKRTGILNFVTP